MSDLTGFLQDYPFPQIGIACVPCGRSGLYKKDSLLRAYGNIPMSDLPRFVAAAGGCERAKIIGGPPCKADRGPLRPKRERILGDVFYEGWQFQLTCERHHQGLKSVRSCPGAHTLDLKTLVAACGHTMRIDGLNRTLCCPTCGSNAFNLMWIVPTGKTG